MKNLARDSRRPGQNEIMDLKQLMSSNSGAKRIPASSLGRGLVDLLLLSLLLCGFLRGKGEGMFVVANAY